MYKDDEVLSFFVNFRKSRATFLSKLEHFDKAPYGFDEDDNKINLRLMQFINARLIPPQRIGYKEMMKSLHCRNGFNLSFRGHGLSLSSHYWYKKAGEKLRYADINFFENKWDDSFARAIIRKDYKALANVDLNVPDIVTSGWGMKAWLYDENKGPRLYKFGIKDNNSEEVIGETLASSLAQKLFNEEEALRYDLEMINGRYASVSSPMIGIDDELIPLSTYLPLDFSSLYRSTHLDKNLYNDFLNKLKEGGYNDLYLHFIKMACLRSLCFVNDLHFGNVSVIKNHKTGKIRVAPFYDLGGSFGSGERAQKFILNRNQATLMLIYFAYGNLDPNWDYSWYDKNRLVGFEDEIRNTLCKGNFYIGEIIDFVVSIYKQQKESLDEIAYQNK